MLYPHIAKGIDSWARKSGMLDWAVVVRLSQSLESCNTYDGGMISVQIQRYSTTRTAHACSYHHVTLAGLLIRVRQHHTCKLCKSLLRYLWSQTDTSEQALASEIMDPPPTPHPNYLLSIHTTSTLSPSFKKQIYKIYSSNMKDMLEKSSHMDFTQRDEFFDPLSRFLVLTHERGGDVACYIVFRFEHENEADIVYL